MKLPPPSRRGRRAGFTLVEIMLAIAIMGVMLSIGIPSIFHAVRKSPLRQAVSDLQEACRTARTLAILQGKATEVVINSQDYSISVRTAPEPREASVIPVGADSAGVQPGQPPPTALPSFSARLPESIGLKLVVNLRDMSDYDEAYIRFYPNGTCDALTATLISEQNEQRIISLEITTGRDNLEVVR